MRKRILLFMLLVLIFTLVGCSSSNANGKDDVKYDTVYYICKELDTSSENIDDWKYVETYYEAKDVASYITVNDDGSIVFDETALVFKKKIETLPDGYTEIHDKKLYWVYSDDSGQGLYAGYAKKGTALYIFENWYVKSVE